MLDDVDVEIDAANGVLRFGSVVVDGLSPRQFSIYLVMARLCLEGRRQSVRICQNGMGGLCGSARQGVGRCQSGEVVGGGFSKAAVYFLLEPLS